MSATLESLAAMLPPPRVRAEDPPTLVGTLRTLARAMIALADADQADRGDGHDRRQRERRRLGPIAAALHAERGRRAYFFPVDLFGEPAWDILLDLYAAAEAGELRSIKAACLAARAPESTALRYIEELRGNGLIERKPDRTDRRRKYLSLTPLGTRKMRDFLASMPPIGDQGEDLIRELVREIGGGRTI